MDRAQCLEVIYPELQDKLVVTIMGACAQELYDLGHRENFFYLQHAMGLASSIGLGLALHLPEERVVVLDGDGSVLMNLGTLATISRYRPTNLIHVVFDNGSLLSTGGFDSHTTSGVTDLAAMARGAGLERVASVGTPMEFGEAFIDALDHDGPSVIVARVRATGPDHYGMDLHLPENAFRFKRLIAEKKKARGASAAASPNPDSVRLSRGDSVSVLPALISALADGSVRVVDLTQPLGPDTPVIGLPDIFAPSPGLSVDVISRYDERGPGWYWNTLTLGEHTGTHFDAPVHWVTGKDLSENRCDTIPAGRFVGPACVIDVSAEVAEDPDFLITPARIEAWEAEHGVIPMGAWALLRTDWSKRTDPADFINLREDGPHSPGFRKDASELLISRGVLGVGVETIGTDAGQAGTFDPPFPNHTLMHGAGKFGLASLCNLDQLPAIGAVVIAAPLKIVDGSGSPLRVLALAPA